jgi:hypothetical protein
VDEQGRVVGVVSRKIKSEGIGFAAKADRLIELREAPDMGPFLGGTWGLGAGFFQGERAEVGGNLTFVFRERLVTRAWLADQRDQRSDREVKDAFPQLTVAAVSSCLAPNDDGASVLAEFDATGRLARCQHGGAEEASVTACLCGRLEGLGPQSTFAGSRWSTSFHIDRRDKLNRDGRLVLSASWNTWTRPKVTPGEKFPRFEERVEDPSLRGWSPGSSRLVAGCFEGRTEPGRVSSRWAVWFDEQGRATKVAEQKGWPPLEVDVAKCVSRLLMTAQAPCPARGNLWAMADLHVTLRDPNAPPETPAMTP